MKIVATDLDRTLIPNGSHRLSKNAMPLFKQLLKKNKLKLIYVTGRNKKQIQDAINRYSLPKPSYAIAMVWTVIYQYGKEVRESKKWTKLLMEEWKNCSREKIAELLNSLKLKQQPMIYLNNFKQSYYVSEKTGKRTVKKINAKLRANGIRAAVVYSVDVNRKVGMIDIMPRQETKILLWTSC